MPYTVNQLRELRVRDEYGNYLIAFTLEIAEMYCAMQARGLLPEEIKQAIEEVIKQN